MCLELPGDELCPREARCPGCLSALGHKDFLALLQLQVQKFSGQRGRGVREFPLAGFGGSAPWCLQLGQEQVAKFGQVWLCWWRKG